MVYINLEDNLTYKDKLLNIIFPVKVESLCGKRVYKISKLNKRTTKAILKKLNLDCEQIVCLSDNLFGNEDFTKILMSKNIRIIDGKWLFKYLSINILNYVCFNKKTESQKEEVTILSEKIDDAVYEIIKDMAKKVKLLNVYTKDEFKIKKLEKELYDEDGIVLNSNVNYKKMLLKSTIVFNFDLTENKLNEFTFPRKTVVVNLNDNININSKGFSGINTIFYDINIPKRYLENKLVFNNFSAPHLYESLIYKHTSSKNILDEIKKDNINIVSLEGRTGTIRKKEYLNLIKS